ncbi:hypothetical protein ACHAXR_004113 [Thalassiosira sp. AJA248-18]
MSSEEKAEEEQGILPRATSTSGEVVENNDDAGGGRLWRICELSGCLALFAVALIVEFVAMPQYIRDIPVQEIDINNQDDNVSSSTSSIYIRNLLFNEEERDETVGTEVLAVVGLLLPFLLQLALASFCTSRRRPYDRYNTICSYFLAAAITFLIVDTLKLYCGYLRPHFYAVCIPDETLQFCTNKDDKENREIRDSFPSGHAGLSLSGLGSFSLYLHHRFGVGSVSRQKANTGVHRIARMWSFVAIFPILLALFMGASRVHDNYHHPADIVGGFAVGGVSAYFCHHLYFLD